MNVTVSYQELIFDINSNKTYSIISQSNSCYQNFRNIILSLLSNRSLTIIDADESLLEISKFSFSNEDLSKTIVGEYEDVRDENDLIQRIEKVDNWELTLFTSGTTGIPKKVKHKFKNLTKFVKKSINHKSDVWGLAYNPTHIAGIQVFFQALMNLNHLVLLFQRPKNEILEIIKQFNITNISSTPTFFRLIVDNNIELNSVKSLTFGGEKFDENIRVALKKMFPKAKFLNVYASTEFGTLFAADGDIFTVKDDLLSLIKIEGHELFVKECLVGNSDSILIVDGWFKTGDKVEVISEFPLKFRFLGRNNECINIGGYNVFPSEVEMAINSITGVVNSRVYGKKNSILGNIIFCDIQRENGSISEKFIIENLKTKLQYHKVPRIIRFVKEIELTNTGKISRK